MKVTPIYFSDLRAGADKLHELLDGKVHIPDKVGIVLMGTLGALVPIALLMHLGGALW